MVAFHNVKTIIIDYVNLIKGIDADDILSFLKSLAIELGVEIIVGVLVERNQDNPKDPTVDLTDLKFGATDSIDGFIPLQSQNQYCF